MDKRSQHLNTIILLFFVGLKVILQYVLVDPVYDLHRDEYLHLDQARHLAWGYESVPPFTSWISLLIYQLGNTVFWIKFFPALFGALTMVVVWKAAAALKGGLFAQVLAAIAVIFSVIVRLNILYQPNSFDVLAWTFLYYVFLQYIITGKNKWLVWAGVGFAVGFLNKYNIVFLLAGLFPAILVTAQRKIFLNKYLYYSTALALVLISGNLAWQYAHDFPVVHHMRTLKETQLVNVSRIDFIKEQVLFFLGSIFVIIAALVGFFIYKPFRQFRVFGWAFIFTLVIFTWLRAKGYYAIGLYPIFLSFGSVYLEQVLKHGWKIYLRPVTYIAILLSFIPMVKIAFPTKPPEELKDRIPLLKSMGMLRWEDGKDHALPQDFADMLGWRELANKVDSVYNSIPDREHVLVICDNYGQAGAINFYTANKELQAVSLNADYINWYPLKTKTIKHVILVKEILDTDKKRKDERPLFETIELKGTVTNPHAREEGTSIYLLKDARTSINKILEEDIEQARQKNAL